MIGGLGGENDCENDWRPRMFYPRLPNVLELSRLHLNASINMSEELTLSFIIVRENGREKVKVL